MSRNDLFFGAMFWSLLTWPFTALLLCLVVAAFLVPNQMGRVERRIVTAVGVVLFLWSIPGLVLFIG